MATAEKGLLESGEEKKNPDALIDQPLGKKYWQGMVQKRGRLKGYLTWREADWLKAWVVDRRIFPTPFQQTQ